MPNRSNDDFLNWMLSPQGQLSEDVLFKVQDALADAAVDSVNRKIVFSDGMVLSIEQAASRIKGDSQVSIHLVRDFVVIWLEQDYSPEGLSDDEMELFEEQIDQWILSCKP